MFRRVPVWLITGSLYLLTAALVVLVQWLTNGGLNGP